ncbi:hypothetical protein HRbin40_00303 [bacterium HR40]|nr:hypothetical protein HRbin40_00303 [bacterium HR40]
MAAGCGLLARARREGRLLLTCDRRLDGRAVAILHLPMAPLEVQARELARQARVDWCRAPFTRCLVDNAPLRPADAGDMRRVPEPAARLPGPFRSCPACGRVFWPGSHVRRMRARLEALAAASQASPTSVRSTKEQVATTQGAGPGAA